MIENIVEKERPDTQKDIQSTQFHFETDID